MESSLPPWWTKQMDEVFLTLLSSQPAARTGLNLRSGQAPAPAPAIEWRTAAQLAEVQLDRGTFLPEFQGLCDLSHLNFIDQLARSPSPTPMAASARQQQRQVQPAPNGHMKAVAPSGAKLARPASEKSAGQGERKGPGARDSTAQLAKKVAAAAAQPANGAKKAGVGKQGQKPAGSDRQAHRPQGKPAGLAVGSDASKEQSAAGMSHQHHRADAQMAPGAAANGGQADLHPKSQAKGQDSSSAAAKPGRRIKVKFGGKLWNQATRDKKVNPKAPDGSASPMTAALREVQGAGAANLPGKALLPKLPKEWLIKAQNAADVRASAEAARLRAAETAERPLPSGESQQQQQAPELPKPSAKAGKKAARAARAGKPAHAEGPSSAAAAGHPDVAHATAKGEAAQEGQAAAAGAVTVDAELAGVAAQQASVAAIAKAEPAAQAGSVPPREATAGAKPKAAGKLAQREEVAAAPTKALLAQQAQQQERSAESQAPAHAQTSRPAQTAVREEPAKQSSKAQPAAAAGQEPDKVLGNAQPAAAAGQEPAKVLDKARPAAAAGQEPAKVSSKAPAEAETCGPPGASATQSADAQPAAARATAPEAPPAAKPAGGRLTGLLRGVTKSGPRLTVKLPVKVSSQPQASTPNGGDAAPAETRPAAAPKPAEQQQSAQQVPVAKAAELRCTAEHASAKDAPVGKPAEVAAAAEHPPAEGASARALEPMAAEGQAALLAEAANPTTFAEKSVAPLELDHAEQKRQTAPLSVGSHIGTERPQEQEHPKAPELAAALLKAGAKREGGAGPTAAQGPPAAGAERSAAAAAAAVVPAAADVGARPLAAPAKAEARSGLAAAREAGAAAAQLPDSQPVAAVAAPAPARGEAAGTQTSKAAAQESSAQSLRPVAPLTVDVPSSAIDTVSPAKQETRQRPVAAPVEQQLPPPVAPVELHQAVARVAAPVEQQLPPPVAAVVSPPQAVARAAAPVEQQLPPPVAAVVSPLTAGALPSVQASAQPATEVQAPPAAASSEPAAPGTEARVDAQHEGREALPRTARGSGGAVAAGQAVRAQPTPPAGVRTVGVPGQQADKAQLGLPEPVTCTAGQPGAGAAAPEIKQAVATAPATKGSEAVAAAPRAKQADAAAPAAKHLKPVAAASHGMQAAATSAAAKHPKTAAAVSLAKQVQPAALAAAVSPKPSPAQVVAAPARQTTKPALKGKLSFGLKSPVKRVLAVNCLKDSRAAATPQAEPQAAAAAAQQQAGAQAPSQSRPQAEPSQQPQRALDRLMGGRHLAGTEAKAAEPGLKALGQQHSTSSMAQREPAAAQQPAVGRASEPGRLGLDKQRSSSFAGREAGSQEPRRDRRRRSPSPPARREGSRDGRSRGQSGRRGSTESSSRIYSTSYTSSGSESSSPSSSPSPVRRRQQEPTQGRGRQRELSHVRHKRREPSHGRHRRGSSEGRGRQYKRQRSSPRYSSSRSLSPRRSSSGFSRMRSDYSDRRRSPAEGRATSSGSTDSPGAKRQRAAPAQGQQGPQLDRQPSVRSRLAESTPAGSGAAEQQPRADGSRGRPSARGGGSAAGQELRAGSVEVQPAARHAASQAAPEEAAAPAGAADPTPVPAPVKPVAAAPATAALAEPATGITGTPAAAARPAPFRMKLVKPGRASLRAPAPAGAQAQQGPPAKPLPQTQQQPAEAAAVQGLPTAAEEQAQLQAAGMPAQAECTGASAEQGAVSGAESRGTSPPVGGAEGQRLSAEAGWAAQLQLVGSSEQRQPAKRTKAGEAPGRRSAEPGKAAAQSSAERGAPQQDPDRAASEPRRRPAQPGRAAARSSAERDKPHQEPSRGAARSSAERPAGDLKGQPMGPSRAAGPPKRRQSASPEDQAPAKRQRPASPRSPASPDLSPKERFFAVLSREDQERVRQYRAIKDPELPSMWLNPEQDYEKLFGISPPAPTPPSQALLQPEEDAPPIASGFQPSEGSTFSPIYGSTPGHLAHAKPAGVKLDKDRLRAQRMLNLETKGSGQQQQQRPLQQPASEPRREVALGPSGQQHAQGSDPVPATATPQPPAAAGLVSGSHQAAPQQTGSGSMLPAGRPAAGTKPAAAQRPLRAGKPPVAAAAAAQPEGQTGAAPPAEAKTASGPKRKRAQEGPAPAVGAVLAASGPGTSQQPEKMRKAVSAGQVLPHAVPCFEADLCQLSKLTAADPKLLTMDSAKVHEEGRQLKQFASKQRDASGKGHTATGIYYMLQACLKFIHAAGLIDGLSKGPAQAANVRVAAQYEDIARLLDMVLGQIHESALLPLQKQGFKLTTERLLSVMLLRGLQATRHPLKACRTGLIDLLPEDVQTAIKERMPATVSQGVRQPGPPAPQTVRRTSPDSNTSASTPMDAGCQLMPSGGATASQAPAATGTGTPAPTGSGGGATPATAGGGGASAGGSASAGSDPVKPGRPRAAGHVESTAQRAQDRPDITLPGWMQEDQARLLSAQRSMQVLLDTTATNVLDLYAFQEKAAKKGDAAAEAAGSLMLFLNSDCIVDFRRILQIGHKVVDSVKNIQN